VPKQKPADEGKTQRQNYIDTARDLGADGDNTAFRDALNTIAQAPVSEPKKKTKR
jgi:hypothetical protein